MATVINLVTEALNLVQVLCTFGVRSIGLVITTWMHLTIATILFPLNIFWRILILIVTLVSLPARILYALQREKLLEMHVHEMLFELENLVWEKRELEEHMQRNINKRRMMDVMLSELQEEHDKAFIKIKLLKCELQDLKRENLRLQAVQRKEFQNTEGDGGTSNGHKTVSADDGVQSSNNGNAVLIQELMMQREAQTGTISRHANVNEFLDRQRWVALSRSFFSLVLSLSVGIIIWEAEEPCMPLVVALFIVIGLSLKSVLQFLSAVKNKPASDAIALLSINLFLLGTLTSPSLPRFAQMFLE